MPLEVMKSKVTFDNISDSVAEPHHFYAAPSPRENFHTAPAPAPTQLHTKPMFLKQTKTNFMVRAFFTSDFY
jgi:hypothetical protein